MYLFTFDGVRSPVKDDVGGAEGPARPVVVHGSSSQLAELGEELVDVRIGNAEVQVGDDQLAGAGLAGDDAAATGAVILKVAKVRD